MSECVVRMEMPIKCSKCFLFEECEAVRKFFYDGGPFPEPMKQEDCRIVAVLPENHGRLGDLDALADDVRRLWDYKTVDGITATTVLNQTLTDIRNCPTIVPAERSET